MMRFLVISLRCLFFAPGLVFVVAPSAQAASPTREVSDKRPTARQPNAPPPATALKLHYHTAPKGSPSSMKDQARHEIPSILIADDGSKVRTKEEWTNKRRPELVDHWMKILGKISPTEQDEKFFGDVTKVKIISTEEKRGYTRIHLQIPLEKDFYQEHLLLVPTGQGKGPFPAVIAWTSTTPDYTQPELWWGEWLARRGFVVLTSWAFIRNYRDGKAFLGGVNEAVYERFGHWLPMAKMVHDAHRQIEFLESRKDVDADRIGFIGFSLSAKSAVYIAAFEPRIKATVSIDPHIAMHGGTNWGAPWYLDWKHRFPSIKTDSYPDPEYRGTIWSLLDADPKRPGFERNHHEVMSLAAPRAFMLIGCSTDQSQAAHSDDAQSTGYVNRAKEVYDLLGVPERFEYVQATTGHKATHSDFDPSWQAFFIRWLK